MTKETNREERIKRLVEKAAGSDLASIGELVNKIMSTIRNPASSAGELKELIEVDPPLCAKVLARANSAYYGFKREISSIQDAIVFIGYNAVNELCLSMKVGKLFESERSLSFYSRKALWAHSLAVAVCSKLIYRREFGERGDNIYSAALLHDLGVMVEEQFAIEEFKQVIKACDGKSGFLVAERAVFGFGHPEIAEALSTQWNLPSWMGVAMRQHHEPDLPLVLGDDTKLAARTLFVADVSCKLNGFGWEDPPLADDIKRWSSCMAELDIKPKAMEIIVEDVKAEMQRLREAGDLYL